jgi:hypothetical protein
VTLSPPHHQHVAELDDLAGSPLIFSILSTVVGGDPVLLAAGLDDCEHRSSLVFDPGARLVVRTGFFQSIGMSAVPEASAN